MCMSGSHTFLHKQFLYLEDPGGQKHAHPSLSIPASSTADGSINMKASCLVPLR